MEKLWVLPLLLFALCSICASIMQDRQYSQIFCDTIDHILYQSRKYHKQESMRTNEHVTGCSNLQTLTWMFLLTLYWMLSVWEMWIWNTGFINNRVLS